MAAKSLVLLLSIIGLSLQLSAQDLTSKARNFLNTLSDDLKSQAQFALNDAERFNMNYVPVVRTGPTFHDFNEQQKKAALDLLRASISNEGYRKATEIMELERVLFIIEDNRNRTPDGKFHRDPLNYHFCVFGNPSPNEIWGWRFEGHHLSLNFISTKGKIVAATPSFWGSNPAIVRETDLKGRQVLKHETELGFSLVNSLNAQQLQVARFSESAPSEIITGNQRKVQGIDPKGIAYSALNPRQQQTFMKLLNVYIDNYEFGFAESLREKINQAGINNLHFAWAGSLNPGQGHYYRIQGPMLLIEYDNVQNNANHVHTVVRDLTNDFAEDILQEHYRRDHN